MATLAPPASGPAVGPRPAAAGPGAAAAQLFPGCCSARRSPSCSSSPATRWCGWSSSRSRSTAGRRCSASRRSSSGSTTTRAVLTDPQFWRVLARSVVFCGVNVALTMVLGMLVALLMTRLGKGMRLLVTVGLLLAWAMPALTAIVIWGWMFDTQYGVVNWRAHRSSGMDYGGHSWLLNPLSFFVVATLVVVWRRVPFVAFTLYAGLTQVPGDVLEAAQLDGASASAAVPAHHGAVHQADPADRHVLPVIWDLRVFTQIFALQDSGGITREDEHDRRLHLPGRCRAGPLRHRQRDRRDHGGDHAGRVVRLRAPDRASGGRCEHRHRLARPGRRRARSGHRLGCATGAGAPRGKAARRTACPAAALALPGEPRRGRGLRVLGLPGLLDGQHVVPAQQPDPQRRTRRSSRRRPTLDNYRHGDVRATSQFPFPTRCGTSLMVTVSHGRRRAGVRSARRAGGDPVPVPRPARASSS